MLTSLDLSEEMVAVIDACIERAKVLRLTEFPLRETVPAEWLSKKGQQKLKEYLEEVEKIKNNRSRSGVINSLLASAFDDPTIMKIFDDEIAEMKASRPTVAQ